MDASDKATGAVIFQKRINDIEQPVAYFSKKFSKHQQNYPHHTERAIRTTVGSATI